MRIAVYTVITNGYDNLKNPIIYNDSLDYICFTDDHNLTSDFWQIRLVNKQSKHLQREIKIKCFDWLPEYDFTIYVDGNITINTDFSHFKLLSEHCISVVKHPKRSCTYREAEAVVILKKDNSKIVSQQLNYYRSEKLPINSGMYQTGVLFRRNCKEIIEFCNFWWEQVEQFSHRDQLSIVFSLIKCGIKPFILPEKFMTQEVNISKHKSSPYLKIHYATPFSVEKNIGKAYNEFMESVPDGEFVCIRDGDTLFLRPDWGSQIHDIVNKNANKFKLISCVTNRLRGLHQLHNNTFSNDGDITNHISIANNRYEQYYDHVEPTTGVAGLCLIFNKDTWKKCHFKENSITFDTEFNKDIRRVFGGNPIGIAKGLYLFHLYRWGKNNPENYIDHLK